MNAGMNMSAALLGVVAITGIGVGGAWLVKARTSLLAWNWHLAAVAVGALLALSIWAGLGIGVDLVLGAMFWIAASGAVAATRMRSFAKNGGGEGRDHELSRVMAWTAWRQRGMRPAVRVGSQGEVIVERRWPDELPYVPLSIDERRGRVPRGEGRHILVLGGTGSGKTVSADRITMGRVLHDRVPALVLDPKGDQRLFADLSSLANAVGRPFVVFDPRDEGSDRWDPLWSAEPGRTVARIVSPLQTTEPYYADTLRIHLGVVAEALQLLGYWPVSMPLLLEAAQAGAFGSIRKQVRTYGGPTALLRRVEEQGAFLGSPSGRRDLASGAARLRVVVGTSWREVLSPRGDGRAVQLPSAMRAGAIVLWRTWVEDLPDEAEAITALALADIVASAAELRGSTEWMVVLDEFGSVMEGNASRAALGVLGRARSSGGQAVVVTQSAADIPTATGVESMRESLADNFSGFVVHRQTSDESRGWVAKLIGTRELWQSTDRMGGGGRYADGTGSRRRVREFLVRPDGLKNLGVGEAYVWTAAGPPPELVKVEIPPPLVQRPPASKHEVYCDAGATALPQYKPPQPVEASTATSTGNEAQGVERGTALAKSSPLDALARKPGAVRDRSSLSRFGDAESNGAGSREAGPDA